MNNYKYLIMDVDDTLLDFGSAFMSAQKGIADFLGVEYSEEFKALDMKVGWEAWKSLRMDCTDDPDIQKNYHTYYYDYLEMHYLLLTEALEIQRPVDELVKHYLDSVTASAVLMEECTLEVIKKLSKKYKLALATNGTIDMQMHRVEAFKPYVDKIYISEAMGVIKPTEEFYKYMLDDLGVSSVECLMIGDSVMNDIKGAQGVGMAVCYYNPKNRELEKGISTDYMISSIRELEGILLN